MFPQPGVRGPIHRCKSDVVVQESGGMCSPLAVLTYMALRGSTLPCFTITVTESTVSIPFWYAPPSRAGALKCMSNVNTFFNISCAGTAPEGRGRTGDIKKGLLYWFITTVAQQCTISSRRSPSPSEVVGGCARSTVPRRTFHLQ
jgi:hypothetical protein